jgi:ankyrin repeat protein
MGRLQVGSGFKRFCRFVRTWRILAATGVLVVPLVAGAIPALAQTPFDLLQGAKSGDMNRIRASLAAKVPVDVRDGRGRTALLIATHHNRIDVARLLIANGADVNAKDKIEDTPYLYAGAEGRNEILRMTLANGANLKDTNRYGGTALIPAAHHGHPETVRILLKTAIAVDHVNKLGWTALLEAIILGNGGPAHTDIVRQLLIAKADPHIADRDGVTPLVHARRRGQAEIVTLLLKAGARK